jgi:hypothetical protein
VVHTRLCMLQRNSIRPNMTVKWVTILLRVRLPIPARRFVVLIEGFRGFPQSVQAIAAIEPQILNSVASEHFRV